MDDMKERAKIAGVDFEWDMEQGLMYRGGFATTAFFRDSSLASLLLGFQAMVGVERFALAQQAEGRKGTDGDWAVITSMPTFEEGFERIASFAAAAGWGRWQIHSIDRAKKELVVRVTSSWEGMIQKALGVQWGSGLIAGKFGNFATRVFGVNCWADQTRAIAAGDEYDEFIARPSTRDIDQELRAIAESDAATRTDLERVLVELRALSSERERALSERAQLITELEDQVSLIRKQQDDILALSAPILQVWDGVVAIPVIGSFTTDRAEEMTDRVLHAVARDGARFAILDLTGVDTVDTATADSLVRVIRSLMLLGTQGVIAGVRPKVAQTVVAMGMELGKVRTFATLRDALRDCIQRMG